MTDKEGAKSTKTDTGIPGIRTLTRTLAKNLAQVDNNMAQVDKNIKNLTGVPRNPTGTLGTWDQLGKNMAKVDTIIKNLTRAPKKPTGTTARHCTKTLTGAPGEGVAELRKRAREIQEAREDTARKASMVEAQIRRPEDYVEHAERDNVQVERRLEGLVKREEAERDRDRRTRQRIGAFGISIGLTRLGAKAQQEEAERKTREAAG